MYQLSTFAPSHLANDLDEIIREKLEIGVEWRCIVLTESMRYMSPPGSFIMIEKAEPRSLKKGEIVVFKAPAGYLAHRVIAIDFSSRTITTRGDSSDADDQPIPFSQYRGRVRVIQNGPIKIARDSLSWRIRSLRSKLLSCLLRTFLFFRSRLQSVIFRLGKMPIAGATIRILSRISVYGTAVALRLASRAECVFARRSFALNEWVPGLSDVDLGIVSNYPEKWQRAFSLLSLFRKAIPFLGEVWVGTMDDLDFCGRHEYRQLEVPSWRALTGELQQPSKEKNILHPFKVRLDCLTELRQALQYFCESVIRFQWDSPLRETARRTMRKHLLNAVIAVHYLENPPATLKDFVPAREKFLRFLRAGAMGSSTLRIISDNVDDLASNRKIRAEHFCSCYQQLHEYLHGLSPNLRDFFLLAGVDLPFSLEAPLLPSIDRAWIVFPYDAGGKELLGRLSLECKGAGVHLGYSPYLLSENVFRLIAVNTYRIFIDYFKGDRGDDTVRWLWYARLAADGLALANRLHAVSNRAIKAPSLNVWLQFQRLAIILLGLRTGIMPEVSEGAEAEDFIPFIPLIHRHCFHMLLKEQTPCEESLRHLRSHGYSFSGSLSDAFRFAAGEADRRLNELREKYK